MGEFAATGSQPACGTGLVALVETTNTPRDAIIYHSRGAVLIIADADGIDRATEAAIRLAGSASNLKIVLCAPGADRLTRSQARISYIPARVTQLSGHLGGFFAQAPTDGDRLQNLGVFSANTDKYFDLVLDFGSTPLLAATEPPYGYFPVATGAEVLERALATIPSLIGKFSKPKYFSYDQSLCAHGEKGIKGCTRCIEACATGAILSVGDKVSIDPYLCQGCAACAMVCPTGAVTYRHSVASPEAIRLALSNPLATRAVLVIHGIESRPEVAAMSSLTDVRIVPLELNPAIGDNGTLWVDALNAGFLGVIVMTGPSMPLQSLSQLKRKISDLKIVLHSLGIDPQRMAVADTSTLATTMEQIHDISSITVEHTAKEFIANSDTHKRARWMESLNLLSVSDERSGIVPLPAGAEFGEVLVEIEKCTLCHACVNLCPTSALTAGVEGNASLWFQEDRCVQCTLCAKACPEQAIQLAPRFVTDSLRRSTPRLVSEDEQALCQACSTPFISKRLLEKSISLMRGLQVTMPAGVDSLRKCPSCRQDETLRV